MKNGRSGAGILEQFLEGVSALSRLEADGRWFLESGYVAGAKAKAIRTLVNGLCREVRAQAILLVDVFGIRDEMLAVPIAVAVGHAST